MLPMHVWARAELADLNEKTQSAPDSTSTYFARAMQQADLAQVIGKRRE
jgi:hypothetical protein